MALRYYQREAVDSVFEYWREDPGHPLVVAATGTGKSIMQATLTTELLDGWPDMRIMNTTHVVELVEGNYLELIGLNQFAPAGIWASSLGRRQRSAQVLFSQLQTVHDKADQIGHVDVLQIDEAHLVPFRQSTMYRRLIDGLLRINSDMKVSGFTATDYRLDGGRLTEGDGRLFDKVVYNYGIRLGIDDGYLTPITSKPVGTHYDLSGVRRSMGEYKASDYRAAVDTDALNARIVEEVLDVEGRRKKALIFCRGVEHSARMAEAFRRAGRAVEVVHGGTESGERRRLIQRLKDGDLWGLANDNILSTGTNIVGVDLIVDCYRTMSAGRYVQRVGRGTRVIWPPGFYPEAVDASARRAAIASWVKPNCRYMDFAGNIDEHGPVDMVSPKKPGNGQGEAPIKVCPNCHELLHASARVCTCCGHEFEFDQTPKVAVKPSYSPIISTEYENTWLPVTGRRFAYHDKPGGTDSVCVHFGCGFVTHRMWVCPEHKGYAKQKADRFWMQHGGTAPAPKSVQEWLDRAGELRPTAEISVRPNGRYFEVVGVRDGEEMKEAA
jgi:DNA repair protein RadD